MLWPTISFYSRTPPNFRVTHLLFNNVGSHGPGGERLFIERYERLRPFADRIGLPFIRVNSNLSDFYPPQLNFMLTHTPRNAAVPLLLQTGISRSLIASTFHFRDLYIGPTDSMAYSDTTALPMLGTERLDFTAVGTEYTRVQKTLRVAQLPQTYDSLDVCTSPLQAGNCSACLKCLRTQLTLEIAGELHRYAAVFSMDVYRQHRAEFMANVVTSERILLRELARFADSSGFSLRAA